LRYVVTRSFDISFLPIEADFEVNVEVEGA
jgi:hypothetical protein